MINRRQFLVSTAFLAGIPIPAAPKYDLLIKGGRVIDPGERLDRIMDIAVRDGKIAALEGSIAASDAMDVFDATARHSRARRYSCASPPG
jgi:dihydroorotase